jgi:hypothetical protein
MRTSEMPSMPNVYEIPSAGIHSVRSTNWKAPDEASNRCQRGRARARSSTEAAIAKSFASRLRLSGKRRSRTAAAVGRKTTTVRRWVPRKLAIPYPASTISRRATMPRRNVSA